MKGITWALGLGCLVLTACSGGGGGSSGSAQAQMLNTTSTIVVGEILINTFTAAETDGVAGVSCPVGALPVSAGCACDIPVSGDIFSSVVVGNGAVCACSIGTGGLANSPIEVSVVCALGVPETVLDSATLSKAQAPAPWDEVLAAKIAHLEAIRAAQ